MPGPDFSCFKTLLNMVVLKAVLAVFYAFGLQVVHHSLYCL